MDVLSESTAESAGASATVMEDCAGDAGLAARVVGGFCDTSPTSCNFDFDDDEVLWLDVL